MPEQLLQTSVRIWAHVDVAFGEEILVCGSVASLGYWDLGKAPVMRQQEHEPYHWVVTVALPCGVRVELKLVVRRRDGSIDWLGSGFYGEDNVVIETSLGGTGSQAFLLFGVDGLPFKLTVEEVEQEVVARKCNAALPRAGPAPVVWPWHAHDVRIRGSWDSWARDIALKPNPSGGFRIMLVLPPGEYHFKFIVDGNWTTSDQMDCSQDGYRNNVLRVKEGVLVPMPIGPCAGCYLCT